MNLFFAALYGGLAGVGVINVMTEGSPRLNAFVVGATIAAALICVVDRMRDGR